MIEIFSNGKKYSGWENPKITRSLDNFSASCSMSLPPKDYSSFPVGIFPGDLIEVYLNEEKVFKGYNRDDSPSFSFGAHSVSISAMETTADIIECSIESPAEFSNKKADEIIREICVLFGIHFSNSKKVNVGAPLKIFSVEPGSKAFETILKLCKSRYLIPISDGIGNASLFDASNCDHGDPVIQGLNILSASGKINDVNRYSKYIILGGGDPKKKLQAVVTDETVERYRPLVIVDTNATTQEQVQARAAWEAKIRAAKSISFNASVSGWKYSKGFWEPGLICPFKAPAAGAVEKIDLLLTSVSYGWGSNGEISELTFMPQDAFAPQPETEKKKKIKKTSDPFARIRKEMRT